MLEPQDLHAIRNIVEEVVEQKLEKKLNPIKLSLRKLNSKLDLTISFFDNEIIDVRKRVNRIEDYLRLPAA